MRISSQAGNRAKNVALTGAFLCGALMLSLAESFIFPAGILPIPGAKLGLANSVILLCAVIMGRASALAVSAARVILMFLLFGNGSSLLYSLSGATLSFIGIAILVDNKKLSFIGKSIISAALHNTAQTLCAAFFMGNFLLALLPLMIIAAILSGAVTGFIINLIYKRIRKITFRRLQI